MKSKPALRKLAFLLLFFLILFSFLSIRLTSPPDVVSEKSPDSVFSAERASRYLFEVAKAPHSTGTSENKRVREYITGVCSQLGLETRVQNTTAIRAFGDRVLVANVYNVIARLKGVNSGKSLLVMAHYDSQPNTPGAGDDGASVAAMLETARILISAKTTFKNDVVFLFTDAEESGLLGAQGFLQDTVLSSNTGLVLNFDNRGNSGISVMFEANEKNGWVVKQFIKGAAYPYANSLSFEIYKRLPNYTDYTLFKQSGISGLNNAFIEGFVNYHSPTDTPENLDMRSLQHHGSNMLSLIKHFGNLELDNTKAPDISYFNVIGNWLVQYPSSWNIVFVILGNLLFLLFLITGILKKRITVKAFIVGFFIFILLLIILFYSTGLFLRGIRSGYPLYDRFYSSNGYNSHYYFLAITAFILAVFSLVYQWAVRKFGDLSLLAGILLCGVGLMNLMYVAMPTAIYIPFFPIFFLMVGCMIIFFRNIYEENEPVLASTISLISLLPAIAILVPVVYLLFAAFGLGLQTAGVVVIVGLLLGLSLPVLRNIFSSNPFFVPATAGIFVVVALVLAHANSDFTKRNPLQSNVRYELHPDENKAFWVSDFAAMDDWNKQFFTRPLANEPGNKYREMSYRGLRGEAPVLPLKAPSAIVKKDTIEKNTRKLSLHFESGREAISMRIFVGDKNPATKIVVNDREYENINGQAKNSKYNIIEYHGLTSTGFDILFETNPKLPFEITLFDRSIGLPDIKEKGTYAENVIPGVGWNSNTTQVKKRFVF